MIGTNKIVLNVATINTAIQGYFDDIFDCGVSVSHTSCKNDIVRIAASSLVLGGAINIELSNGFLVLCLTSYLKKSVIKNDAFDVISVRHVGYPDESYEVTIKEIAND